MKNRKILHYFVAVLMLMLGVLFGSANEVKAATYVPFSVNLFDYATGEDTDSQMDEGTINASLRDAGSVFRFRWNTWGSDGSDVNDYAVKQQQGIVQTELLDGKIQFNNNYDPKSVGLFDPDIQVAGKSVYTNVQLPFQYADGYYTFDSDEYDVYFENGTGVSGATLIANETQTPVYGITNGWWRESITGFFPFNAHGNNEDAQYHFGMTFSTEFFMTADGKINGEEIVFEFSGDDDIWIFVDNKLVLDMGGIHDKVDGEINFAEGTSIINNTENGTQAGGLASGDLWELLNTTAEDWRNSTTPHTLQIFYLERGAGGSNCKIRFNLPQKNCISVTKVMGNNPASQEELDRLNELSFNFIAYTKAGNTETALKNRMYYLYDSTGQLVGGYKTDENGRFALGFGQNARFYIDNEYSGQEVYVVEQQSLKLLGIDWTVTKNNETSKTQSATDPNIVDASYKSPSLTIDALTGGSTSALQMYSFVCTNEVANPQAVNDVVVLDYGKPVIIDILKNDTFFRDSPTIKLKTGTTTEYNQDSLNLTNGTAELSGKEVKYTPTDYMDSVDRFGYKIESTEGNSTAEVQVIPATNVYYEDNFATTNNGTVKIQFTGEVKQEGTSIADNQSDENIVYGYDASYVGEDGDSNGTSQSMAGGATATFTFNGTGVEIYSRTDTKSPVIIGRVYTVADGTETLTKAIIVDNKYDKDTLYQIPTICFDMETYGTYKVVLTVSATEENSNYYLDGIRIYNPINVNSDSADATDAKNAYQAAGENDAFVQEVRDILIAANSFSGGNESVDGVVYLDIDTNGNPTIKDYEVDGPKNEVYLNNGNAIAFTLRPNGNAYNDANKVYIGLKAPQGNSTTVTVTNGTTNKTINIDGAADLYYEITPTSAGQVVIRNTGNGLLSITKVRISNVQQTAATPAVAMFMVDEETIAYAQTFSLLEETVPGEDTETDDGNGDVEIPDVEEPDIDVDIDNPDDSEEVEKPAPSKQEQIANLIKGIATGILKLFGII